MLSFKSCILLLLIILPNIFVAQSIEISSFDQNPVEVSPLLGGNLQINFEYTSQSGSSGNNLYIGLEELDANNQFVRTIDGISLENEPAGNAVQCSVNLFVGSIHPLSADLPPGHFYQVIARLYTDNWTELSSAGYWNTPAITTQDSFGYNFSNKSIIKGADVSWMTEMEADGVTWQDNEGNAKALMPLLAEYDLSAVRLRVWVNPDVSPANGWCDIEDMVNKAILADNQGLDVMVCIHYSDHWADPGQQTKPSAWENKTVAQLEAAVANHTTDILNALNAEGITPKWVQIGNETNNGMLWDTGKASAGGFVNYAKFLNAGSQAVKTFDSSIQTILHLANGDDQNVFNWNIGGLLNNGLDFNRFDIIGMSLYPNETNWKSKVEDTCEHMLSLQSTYNKEIMMVEVGFPRRFPAKAYQFLVYMIEKTKQANGLGVLYWEPIAHSDWTSYNKGAWDNDGSPSEIMDAFLDKTTMNTTAFKIEEDFMLYPNPSADILNIQSKFTPMTSISLFDFNGRIIRDYAYLDGVSFTSIDISSLSKGLYFLRVNNQNTLKFIKNY